MVVMVSGEMDKSLNDQLLLLLLMLLLGVTRLDTLALIACAAEVDEAMRLDARPEKEGKAGVVVVVVVDVDAADTPLSSSSRPSIIEDAAVEEAVADPLTLFADDDPLPPFHLAEMDPANDDNRLPSKGSIVALLSPPPPIHPR